MKLTSVEVTPEQKAFLDTIVFEDAATSIGGINGGNAVQWCIDACMRIEKLYEVDACYISFNDVRLTENNPKHQ